ncbi:MAG: hypothetical protein KAX19_02410, partial [Candidatus Brocadiae bacterium]|nr:hypothetical protein [Candidatus Brocadiia bacterium]
MTESAAARTLAAWHDLTGVDAIPEIVNARELSGRPELPAVVTPGHNLRFVLVVPLGRFVELVEIQPSGCAEMP